MSKWFIVDINWIDPEITSNLHGQYADSDAALADARMIYKHRLSQISSFSVRRVKERS